MMDLVLLCFVGLIIKCIYDISVIWLQYIYFMTSSISYRLVDLIWINRMHNEWMNSPMPSCYVQGQLYIILYCLLLKK
jgi:hypothetical protein